MGVVVPAKDNFNFVIVHLLLLFMFYDNYLSYVIFKALGLNFAIKSEGYRRQFLVLLHF